MPTPSEATRAVLTILGVEVPPEMIGKPGGEALTDEEPATLATPHPNGCGCAVCCPQPFTCPTGVDPDLIEESIEAQLDAALFQED